MTGPSAHDPQTREARSAAFTWVDVERPTQEEMDRLGARFGFHPLEIEDVLSTRQRNKIERQRDHLFAILRFPWFGDDHHGQLRSQVSIFLGKDYLVTVHGGGLEAIGHVWESCRIDAGGLGASPGFVVYRLIDSLVDGLFPVMDSFTEQLADIEEAVFDEKTAVVRVITDLRRRAHHVRASIIPLKRVVAELSTELWGRDATLVPYLKDVNDHLEKVWERIEEVRETVEIYKDSYVALSTAKTNKILGVLTIAFTLAIPASVVGTFYGMNVNLPGGIEPGPWTFLGPYTTLIVVVTFSLVLPAMAMLWAFRRLQWI